MSRALEHDELSEMRVALLRDEAVDPAKVLLAVEELLRKREDGAGVMGGKGVERTWSAHGRR